MPIDLNKTLVTKKEVAKRYGVSTRTINSWMRRGLIPFKRISSKMIRFDIEQCDAALKTHEHLGVLGKMQPDPSVAQVPVEPAGRRTFALLKPDAVRRRLIPEILDRFQKAGLEIIKIQSGFCDEDIAFQHYADLADRGNGIMDRNAHFISSGMTVALILEGNNAVARARATIGSTEPLKASPGTIRGDFGSDTIGDADRERRGLENLVHASDSDKSAKSEIKLWFPGFPQ